jgi:hypothetical protein
METMININDIKLYKSISSNINTIKELDPFILEAQDFDLRAFMSESFYLDFIDDFFASPSLAKYSDLWNGQEYEYGGYRYKHEGLKAILIHHSYARFLSHANVTSTPYGIVSKTNQYSEKADEKTMSRLIQQARSSASVFEERVEKYLNWHSSDFSLWRNCKTSENKYKSGVKFRQV